MSKRKTNREKQTTGEQQEAVGQEMDRQGRKKELERLILEYTEELARDINLRLLAQQDIEPAGLRRGRYHTGDVLYVESIIVTDVRYPEQKKRDRSLTGIGRNVRNILKSGQERRKPLRNGGRRPSHKCSGMEE